MNTMKCYLCNGDKFSQRPGEVRDDNTLNVVECNNCGLVTLDSFSHISGSHYEDGKMHSSQNTIIEWLQETEVDDSRRFKEFKKSITGKNMLDVGSGNGGFLTMAVQIANLAQGLELETRVQEYYKDNRIKIWKSIEDVKINCDNKFDLITSFHVFEHLIDPVSTLKSLSSLANQGGEIIIEVPSCDDALLTLYNSESFAKFTYWSQHLFLFNQKTIELLVNKANMKLNWIKQVQRYGLSNHLYWLSNNLPGGQKSWSFLNSKLLDKLYAKQLASVGKCDTLIFSFGIKNN
jgi:2-polyprenyl-3-methyl-5-hydroxy-6-metoxy-1,4-benzoquinol methylase